MKICENGVIREVTEEELAQAKDLPDIPYEQRVSSRIRAKYSVDDELAILRQRDTKPVEFAKYYAFAEQIKLEERTV